MRLSHALWVASVAMVVSFTPTLGADEPAACRSTNPVNWPASSKPYFLLAVDTSGSMNDSSTTWNNSCAYHSDASDTTPEGRKNDAARCAIYNTVNAFSGLVHFGLMTFPTRIEYDGSGTVQASCNDFISAPGNSGSNDNCRTVNPTGDSCGANWSTACCLAGGDATTYPFGNTTTCTGTAGALHKTTRGGRVMVGLQQDDYWNTPPTVASNVTDILKWVDNDCTSCEELWASGSTPLHGLLRDAQRYLTSSWTNASFGAAVFSTPLTGTERGCRSVNVILLTDGEEYCEPSKGAANSDAACAANAAYDLFNTGVTIGANTFHVRTHVIALGTVAGVDNIAFGGGTGDAYIANDEAELSAALANIVSSAIPPETCNNTDDNCNGCSDEGFKTYCNRNKTSRTVAQLTAPGYVPNPDHCCATAERAACLQAFRDSVDPVTNPQGSKYFLPCWTPTGAGATDPEDKWICNDPGESCDNADNNCEVSWSTLASNTVDEGFDKCAGGDANGCPAAEVCDSQDNDCDGFADNLSVAECQADPDCSLNPTPSCPVCVPNPPEVCNGQDDDCDGRVDEEIAPIPCGLLDSPHAFCKGVRTCAELGAPGSNGFGPCSDDPGSTDATCNGIDEDCDGIADDEAAATPCVPTGTDPSLVYYDPVLHPDTRCRMGGLPCVAGAVCTGFIGPIPEECNGIDDDCDGAVDERDGGVLLPGEGEPGCGTDTGECQKGTTECVGGNIVCGGDYVGPALTEVCDGRDADCDGRADEEDTLDDAPSTPGCWLVEPTTCTTPCSHGGFSWCPPEGAECDAVGSLVAPCAPGTLSCVAGGWTCTGGRLPDTEVCDGLDNDCNDDIDDGALGAPVGLACGITEGDCDTGVNVCNAGVIECTGQGPVPEVCDGSDNDCDGTVDNGLALGEECAVPHDESVYPGERNQGECRPGASECDPLNPEVPHCIGGVGPTPEVCDGKDNDCDGDIDESGPAPDGIDGTEDPFDTSDPKRRLGDACGSELGVCLEGQLGCVDGQVICVGGIAAQSETCDCADNDCDGDADEPPSGGQPALCSPGKTCVDAGDFCLCVEQCGGGEFPCPTGTECETVPESYSRTEAAYCLPDLDAVCGDCATRTVLDTTDTIVCAPEGSAPASLNVPVCVCKGTAGCQSPCYGIQCSAGQDCVPTGPAQGQCQPRDNCYFFGCAAGRACSGGACVDDPCDPNPCPAAEVCRPNTSFTEPRCVATCAGVTCATGQACTEGSCVDTACTSGCASDQYCSPGGDCVANQCDTTDGLACANGAYCEPATGACGDDPCTAVVCPEAQTCRAGECVEQTIVTPSGGAGGVGGAGSGNTGGATGLGGSATAGANGTGSAPSPEPEPERGAWGLATGGGGCACRTTHDRRPPAAAGLAACLALAWLARRRRREVPATAKGGVR